MVDIASTNARRQVHGSWGAGKRAGRLTKHGIDMDGGDEAAEAVTEDVAAHSTRALLNTETQRQLTEHKAPRHELLCKPDSSFYSASTIFAVKIPLRAAAVAALSGGVFRKSDLRKMTAFRRSGLKTKRTQSVVVD